MVLGVVQKGIMGQSHIVLALVQNLRPGGRFEQLNFAQKLYALAKEINTRGKGLREKTRIKMKVLAVGEW